jgi:hypothetical protein
MEKVYYKVSTNVYDDYVKKYERIQEKNEDIEGSTAYKLCEGAATYFDTWCLDPILGFFFPGIGDLICSLTVTPSVYLAVFKLKSFRLTIAILQTWLLDLVVGSIPLAGDIIDFLYKSNKIAFRLVLGYHKKDPAVMKEINRRCAYFVLTCVAAYFAIVWVIEMATKAFNFVVGLLE